MAVTNNFASSELDLNNVITLSQPTALVWGPDGRLYVSEVDGSIKVLTVVFGDPDPTDGNPAPKFYVTEAFELTTITGFNYNDDGTYNPTVQEQGRERQVTGIDVVQQYDANGDPVFLPDGKPAVDIYVTSSDPRHGAGNNGQDKNLDTNSGVVHRLRETADVDSVATPDDAFTTVDLVRGFSRSEENHSINGLEIIQEIDEATGKLLSERAIVAVGGNANTGAPSNNFAAQQEYATSAGIFEIDITMLDGMIVQTDATSGRDFIYDLPTLDDPTQAGTSDQNDPFGGNDGFNQAILLANDDPNNPVTMYSPGYRNAYDVEVTEDGRVWTYDNGANNSWGGRPIGEAGDNGGTTDFAQDPNYIATNLNNGDGNANDEINLEAWNPSNLDNFHEITRSDDLDAGETLSVGGNGPVTTYTDPDTGLTLVYGGHPNPTRAEGSKAGLLYSPTGTDDDAVLLVSDTNTAGDNLQPSDYDDVIAWYTQVESDYGLAAGFLTKRVVEATPGVVYDIYEATDGTAIAVVSGGAAPGGGAVFIGTTGLPSDIHSVVTTLNPIEGNYLEAGYTDGALDSAFGSVNGLAEYTSTILDDPGTGTKMSGAILASTFNGGGLIVMGRNADGTMSSVSGSNGAVAADRTVIVDSGQTLGLATIGDNIADLGLSNAFQGSIWAAVYKIGAGFSVDIEIFQPVGVGIPLADQIVTDPTDQDGDGIDVYNDPFEFSATNGYDLTVGQTLNLDFEANTSAFAGSFAGTGLLGAALDGGANPTPNWDAQTAEEQFPVELQRDGLFDDGGNIIPGGNAPVFQIKDVVEGTVVGTENSVRDAMHTGVNLDSEVKTLVATLNMKNWVATQTGGAAEGQLTGMMFSDGTQSNFLRIVFGGVSGTGNNPGLEVGWELGDTGYATLAQIALPGLSSTANTEVDLRLTIRGIGTTFDVTVEYKLESESDFTEVPLNGGAGFQLPAGVLQDVLTGSHTITDSDGPVASSGAAIGLLAETPPGTELLAIDFNNLAIEARGNEIPATTAAEVGTAGTTGVDTIVYTGTDTALDPLASDVENFDGTGSAADYAVTGNALENLIEVGQGTNTITLGGGNDSLVGTLAQLAGDTITDMAIGDKIVITDLTLADAATVTYGGAGFAELTINGSTLTFTGPDFVDFDPADGDAIFTFIETTEGLEITAVPPSLLETVVYRINFGGAGSVAAIDGGPDWADDDAVINGFSSTIPNDFITPGSVFNVDYDNVDAAVVPDAVFQTESSDNDGSDAPSTLNFNVEVGRTYRIEYYYTENWQNIFDNAPRIFDVEVEGAVPAAFDDLNPLAEAEAFVVANGGQTIAAAGITNSSTGAEKNPYLNVARKAEYIYTATDDTLNLALIHQAQNPKINAIQVSIFGTPSNDVLVSIGNTPAIVENGDSGTTLIQLPLSVAEPGFTGTLTLDFDVTVNGVTQAFLGQAVNFVDTGAFIDVTVPADIQNNGDDTVSVTLTGVAEAGYAIDGAAATGTSSVTEDDAPINPTFPFVEATQGDLSDDRFNPTDFGQLAEGDNLVTATQQGDSEPGGRERDYFTFEVPVGQVLTQLILVDYIPGETSGAQAGFMGLAAGSIFDVDPETLAQNQTIPEMLGGHVYDPTEIGTDLLPEFADGDVFGVTTQGFNLPLGPGVYTLWLNQGGEASTPTINLKTVPASSLPSIAIANAPTVVESGDTGVTTLAFPVSITPAEATTLTLSFTVDGGAETSASVTFDASGNGTLNIDVANDDTFNGTEVVNVVLTGAENGVAGDFFVIDGAANSATGSVTEDEQLPATAPTGDFDNDTIANQDDTDIDGDGGGAADNSTSTDGLLDVSETFIFDATNAGTALAVGQIVRQEFDVDGTPFMNGFTGALLSPNAVATEVDLNAADVSGGTLNITVNKGDHFGDNNNQQNAFVAAYTAPQGLAVETRFEIPDFGAAAGVQSAQNFQAVGVVVGTDQNNMVKAVWGREAQVFQLFQDNASGGLESDLLTGAGTTPAGAAEISIRLEVFLENVDVGGVPTPTAKARAVATFYDGTGAAIAGFENVAIGEITLEDNAGEGNSLKTLVESGAPLGAGIIQTSVGNAAPASFDVSYQYLEVTGLGVDPNDTAPTVALTNAVVSIPEDTDLSTSVKVADIAVTDDGLSTVALALSGDDAGLFEIVDNGGALELHLSAGAALDFETNGTLDVTVEATDSVGTGSAAFSAAVGDVNEAPTVTGTIADTTILTGTPTAIDLSSLVLADQDAGDVPSLKVLVGGVDVSGAPGVPGFTLNGTTLEVDGTVAAAAYSVDILANDGVLDSTSAVSFTVTVSAEFATTVFEVEDFDNVQPLSQSNPGEFFEENQTTASGGQVARLATNSTGTASLTLDASDGVVFGPNDIEVTYFDESDGVSTFTVNVDGVPLGTVTMNNDGGGNAAQAVNLRTVTFNDVDLQAGSVITIDGVAQTGEYVRLDKITISNGDGGPVPGNPIRIQVEDFDNIADAGGFFVENQSAADGGQVARLAQNASGEATLALDGVTGFIPGTFNLAIGFFDETDGNSTVTVIVRTGAGDTVIGVIDLDLNAGGNAAQASSFREVTLSGVELPAGAELVLAGVADTGEFVRLDYVDLIPFGGSSDALISVESAVSVVEDGDTGTTTANLGLTVTPATVGDVDITFSTDGGATTSVQTVTFDASGAGTLSVAIAGFNDDLDNGNDTATVTLIDATTPGFAINGANAASVVTVIEDDSAVQGTIALRINAFGDDIPTLDAGPSWLGDIVGAGARQYLTVVDDRGDTFNGYVGDPNAIPSGVPETVLDTARSSDVPFTYSIPVTDIGGAGLYRVNLYVAELFANAQSGGSRNYDASLEGVVISAFNDIDPGALFGADVGVLTGEVDVLDGVLDIGFLQDIADNPLINGIEIIKVDGVDDTTGPGATIALSAPSTASDPLLVNITLTDLSGIDTATLDAGDIEVQVGGVPLAANTISFDGFAGNVASYSVAAPTGGWVDGDVDVTLKAGEIFDLAATPNGNAAVAATITLDFSAPPTNPTEATAILEAAQGVDSGASYGANVIGSAELRIMAGESDVQSSNFGNNSFILENTGDKQIAGIVIDFRDALYGDSVIDTDGSSGDLATKPFAIQSGAGVTGVIASGNNNQLSLTESYFFPGNEPNPDPDPNAANGGFRGLLLRFDGTDGGFANGEQIGFSGDMDPNSVATIAKAALDSGAVNGWDVGGISGAELIGSSFTVMFDDGTFATGYIGSDGSQAGSTGKATQAVDPIATATVTVNGSSSGSAGTYGGTEPVIVISGTPGDTVLVTMSKGLNPATNTANNIAQDVADRLANAQPDFQVSNAGNFQTVQVTIGAGGTATVPAGSFDYNTATATGITFGGSSFTEAFATAPMVIAASVIDTDGQPAGPVDRVYLTSNGQPVGSPPPTSNNAPVATDDSAELQGSSVLIDVLANDSDIDGDTLTITDIGTPSNGTAVLQNGAILYTSGGEALINTGFESGAGGFTYTDDTFRGTSQPAYASGNSGIGLGQSGGGLTVALGAVDNATVNGMSGGWSTGFTMASAGAATLSFSYRLQAANGYEPDEFSEVLVSLDGALTGLSGNDYIAQISGGGDSGWVDVSLDLGTLSAGSHNLILGGYNNKKTFGDEETTVSFDNVSLIADTGSSTPLPDMFTYTISDGRGGTSTAAVDITTEPVDPNAFNAATDNVTTAPGTPILIDVLANDTGGTGPYSLTSVSSAANGTVEIQGNSVLYTPGSGAGTVTPIDASFDTDADQFVFADDLFRGTNNPAEATGSYVSSGGNSGGGLEVVVGGVNADDVIDGMSGGWTRDVTLTSSGQATLSFAYNLTVANPYESDEFGEALFALDGTLIGLNGNDYLAQINGGGTTGWQTATLNLGLLDAGVHSFDFGAFNNKKTTADEFTTVLFDNITLSVTSDSDSFTYVATDNVGDSDTGIVIINFDDIA